MHPRSGIRSRLTLWTKRNRRFVAGVRTGSHDTGTGCYLHLHDSSYPQKHGPQKALECASSSFSLLVAPSLAKDVLCPIKQKGSENTVTREQTRLTRANWSSSCQLSLLSKVHSLPCKHQTSLKCQCDCSARGMHNPEKSDRLSFFPN